MPFTVAFVDMDAPVRDCVDAHGDMADTIAGAMSKTHRSIIGTHARARAKSEMAAAALLAGSDVLIADFRAGVAPLSASLINQTQAIAAAWNTFGATGRWVAPARATLPVINLRDAVFGVAAPRPLAEGERITAETTERVIDAAWSSMKNFSIDGRRMFAGAARGDMYLDGELADALDTSALDHTRVFARLNAAVTTNVLRHITAVQASWQRYQATGQWATPTVVLA